MISALIIVRFLPSFLMFPLAGVVADRFVPGTLPLCTLSVAASVTHSIISFQNIFLESRVDRPKVMLVSTVVNIFIVLGLTLIKHPQDIW